MNKTIEVIKDIRTLCTHVFEGGHRCASPALQREAFCYYHHPTRKPIQNPTPRRSRRQSFALPLPSGQSDRSDPASRSQPDQHPPRWPDPQRPPQCQPELATDHKFLTALTCATKQ